MSFCSHSGKVIHATRSAAARAKKFGKCGKDTNVETYRCPHCDGWHLGHGVGKPAIEPEVVRLVRPEK